MLHAFGYLGYLGWLLWTAYVQLHVRGMSITVEVIIDASLIESSWSPQRIGGTVV